MYLTILNKKIKLDNNENGIKEIEDLVNQVLESDRTLYFSHFIINGSDVYENYADVIENNIEKIKSIEACIKNIEELIKENLISLEAYLDRAVGSILVFSDTLYNGDSKFQSEETVQVIEGIQWLLQVATNIDMINDKPVNFYKVVEKVTELETVLKEMEETILNDDIIVFADMLQYELVPLFESIKGQVSMIINEEGFRDDLH